MRVGVIFKVPNDLESRGIDMEADATVDSLRTKIQEMDPNLKQYYMRLKVFGSHIELHDKKEDGSDYRLRDFTGDNDKRLSVEVFASRLRPSSNFGGSNKRRRNSKKNKKANKSRRRGRK
jgi:hypothetical protein